MAVYVCAGCDREPANAIDAILHMAVRGHPVFRIEQPGGPR